MKTQVLACERAQLLTVIYSRNMKGRTRSLLQTIWPRSTATTWATRVNTRPSSGSTTSGCRIRTTPCRGSKTRTTRTIKSSWWLRFNFKDKCRRVPARSLRHLLERITREPTSIYDTKEGGCPERRRRVSIRKQVSERRRRTTVGVTSAVRNPVLRRGGRVQTSSFQTVPRFKNRPRRRNTLSRRTPWLNYSFAPQAPRVIL